MIRIPCPHCGLRNSSDFRYGGEPRKRPPSGDVTPTEFRAYLYERTNKLGWVVENWYHSAGCRRYIQVERHTFTNECRPVQQTADSQEAS